MNFGRHQCAGQTILGMTRTLQQETAMHWRNVPSSSNGKVFYVVLLALTALVAVSTVLLVLHFHA